MVPMMGPIDRGAGPGQRAAPVQESHLFRALWDWREGRPSLDENGNLVIGQHERHQTAADRLSSSSQRPDAMLLFVTVRSRGRVSDTVTLSTAVRRRNRVSDGTAVHRDSGSIPSLFFAFGRRMCSLRVETVRADPSSQPISADEWRLSVLRPGAGSRPTRHLCDVEFREIVRARRKRRRCRHLGSFPVHVLREWHIPDGHLLAWQARNLGSGRPAPESSRNGPGKVRDEFNRASRVVAQVIRR